MRRRLRRVLAGELAAIQIDYNRICKRVARPMMMRLFYARA